MNICALDTASLACSVALMTDGRLRGERLANNGLTHSQTLMPMLEELLRSEGLRPKDIDVFAAVTGPGSFTGVRIGVCAVKGLCEATGARAAVVDALEALAWAAQYEGLILPILDARRQQVYTALFRKTRGEFERLTDDMAAPLIEVIKTLPGDETVLFTGDGLNVHEEAVKTALGDRALAASPSQRVIRASAACEIALSRPESYIDALELTPLYLRMSQAERERAERLGGA
ncbi:MAG: tRNA (adenosine(37)-N6)-threonylcarbamoyltransferase complex dimerization subunit type 1 TsaB [Clostridia bacterium]|nr:tRNA (adenosine(37)-N6)-threonylcarbamoyltransferase complex dimerization subunit type 1 TsaB [Clostridia bacterium]MBR5985652.1 tRNA (adenosine(37)-N6)-threonylcarbamoyltransferase complex dimerization subunit type 1 TsaB [Clostridia bacterium]